jgi:hypothetical protein
MHNDANGYESFMVGLRALVEGFGFFFSGFSIALRIWYAKGKAWALAVPARSKAWIHHEWRVPTWGLMTIVFTLTVTVSYWSLILNSLYHG